MARIYFNSRDELIAVDIENIAVIYADGNYTKVIYMNKRELTLSMGITKVSEMLLRHPSPTAHFIRIGRSCIINHAFTERIDVIRQFVVMSDEYGHEIRVKASKPILKSYKTAILNGVQNCKGEEDV